MVSKILFKISGLPDLRSRRRPVGEWPALVGYSLVFALAQDSSGGNFASYALFETLSGSFQTVSGLQ